MEQIKGMTNAIDQATSDMQQGPNPDIYVQVEKFINTRADMPKHCIAHISKRLMIKNDKVTFLTIDLLQYIMYVTELPFWGQLCTKEFLMKLSQILQSKDSSSQVSQRILQFVKCEHQLFKPHQDLLPFFFQFYEGLIKKGYDHKNEYVSPYRPKELKKYPSRAETKAQQKPSTSGSTAIQPKNVKKDEPQQQSMSAIKERIVLTNEIIDECNPAQQVKNNNLLIEMMTSLKEIEKTLNNVIVQGSDEKTTEEAIALNDDLLITYRRFKDLQKNKKPEPFMKTELVSSYIVKEEEAPKEPRKTQHRSIFDQFDLNSNPSTVPSKKNEHKQEVDIFGLNQKSVDTKPIPNKNFNIFELDQAQPPKNINAINNNPHPINMDTLTSVQMNMGTMSTPMQNVSNFNSGLLGLSINPIPSSQPQLSVLHMNDSSPQNSFKFGEISSNTSNNLFGISLNTGSGLNYNNQFATEAVKIGQYSESDLTDLNDLFSRKL